MTSSPKPAHPHEHMATWLAHAGLIPFALFTMMAVFGYEIALAIKGLVIYSLGIVCFLAGSWWGFALLIKDITRIQRGTILVLSNAIVIIAVAAVMLLEPTFAAFILASLYFALLMGEKHINGLRNQPAYYNAMRTRVTLFAIGAHLLTVFSDVPLPT